MAQTLIFHHREFENEVRQQTQIFDRPVPAEEVKTVKQLDLSNFDFLEEDEQTLMLFCGLERLFINTASENHSFLSALTNLKELDLTCHNERNTVDFRVFRHLEKLQWLFVSGGDISDIDFLNLDALIEVPSLRVLRLHEFGTVDLQPLAQMPWLTDFFCGYANDVAHMEAIGNLRDLKSLELVAVKADTLDFLDMLPADMHLELCGVTVQKDSGTERLQRFSSYDICEMTIGDKSVGDMSSEKGGGLTKKEKELIHIMKEIGADSDTVFGTLLFLTKHSGDIGKLLAYMYAKGKYLTLQDVLSKCSQICLPREHCLPCGMFVRYTGETTNTLLKGEYYEVLISYDHDRSFNVENEQGEEEEIPIAKCEPVEVARIRYLGREEDDGTVTITKGFAVGGEYTVIAFKNGRYLCKNKLCCWVDEAKPIGFVPKKPKPVMPFRHKDGALRALRLAMEFGNTTTLEDHLAPDCKYISQDAEVEFSGALNILRYMKNVARQQLSENIFLDCVPAVTTNTEDGNLFPIGKRCLAVYMGGTPAFVVFAEETDGVIHGIYVLTENYDLALDEP